MANRHNTGKMKKIPTGGTVRHGNGVGNKNVIADAQDTKTKTNLPIAGGLSGKGIGRKRGGKC